MMSNPIHILSFFLLALFWGGSFISIGIAVKQLPPFFAAFIRVFICFLLMLFYLLAKERKLERPKVWLESMGTGAFLMGIPWIFLFWGEKVVTPAMAAILNGTVPIFTTLFMPWITPKERPGLNKWLGVLVGFIGLGIIFGPEISFDLTRHLQGLIAILLMAICYAIGVLWTRRIAQKVRNSVNLFYQSFCGSLILLLSTALFELPHQSIAWSWPAFFALMYLGVFSTAIAWLLFFKLVKEVGSVQATAVTYCVPLIALILDFFFWDKWIALHQAVGACIILLGVFLINRR